MSGAPAVREERIDYVRGLTSASASINSHLAVEDMLDELCRQAARLTRARLAIATVVPDGDWQRAHTAWHGLDDDVAVPGRRVVVDGRGIETRVCEASRTVRMTAAQLEASPELAAAVRGSRFRPALRGWLAAPLLTRAGDNMGLVQVSRREVGDFSLEEEAVLDSLAHLASVAIDKARVYELAAEQELARLRQEILAGISHDMQTPLAAISGIVDMLTDGPLDDEEQASLHQALQRQNRNLRALVQQFLDFSRLESSRELLIRPRVTDVVVVMEQAVELFAHEREIVLGAEAGLPPAMADPDRLQQVLVNLLSNAVKYSEQAVRVVARRIASQVVIDVVDEGRGMDERDLADLFRKFHRGANASGTEGTGLGLYVSRALVEAQGGTLTATSTPGWGTRFRVVLPVTAREGAAA